MTSLREPRTLAVGVALPVVLLVLFNSILGSSGVVARGAGAPIDIRAYYVGGIAAYAIAMQCFSLVVISIAAQREMGQLKRLQGTPAPAWTFIASVVLRSLTFAAAMVIVLFFLGGIAYVLHLRREAWLEIMVYTVLGTASMTALGLAVATFMPTAETAAAVGPLATLILSFASGIFIPVAQLPGWLDAIGRVFPLYHLGDGFERAMGTGSGGGLAANDVLLLVAWAVAGAIVATRRFRWDPARS